MGGAQPIGGWEGGDKYNLNNLKQSFAILSKVEGLTPTIYIAPPKHNICMYCSTRLNIHVSVSCSF